MIHFAQYNVQLVILSFLIAVISAFISLDLIDKEKSYIKMRQIGHQVIAGMILGFGIWSMHFIAMLAHPFHIDVTYNVFLTILSMCLAVVGAAAAFFVVGRDRVTIYLFALGGFLMGAAIVSMHYVGMAAMEMELVLSYDPLWVLVSIMIAVLTSFLALALLIYWESHNNQFALLKKVLVSIVMGTGIALMHYTAMVATTFETTNSVQQAIAPKIIFRGDISISALSSLIVLMMFVLFSAFILNAYLVRNKALKMQELSEQHFQSLFIHSPFLVFSINLDGDITNINPCGLRMLNNSQFKMRLNKVDHFFQLQDQQSIRSKFEKVKKGIPQSFESVMVIDGEGAFHMSCTLIPIKVANERPIGAFLLAKDVTDVVTYEEELRKAQSDLQNTMRQQQGMIFTIVKQENSFVHTLCDGELLYKVGFTPEDIVGKSLAEFLSEEEALYKTRYYQKAWDGYDTNYEGEINGIHYLAILKPVFYQDEVIEVIGSCVDITDRKQMEEALRDKEALYRTALNTMSEGVMIFEEDNHLITLNENVEKILGIKEGMFTEESLSPLNMEFVDENGVSIPFEHIPGMKTKKLGVSIQDEVLGVKVNDKIVKWISVNSNPFTISEDKQNRALLTIDDITLQKEQELRLRESYALQKALIDNLKIGIAVTDENRKIILLNDTFCEMLGIKGNYDSYIGQSGRSLYERYVNKFSGFEEQSITKIVRNRKIVTEQMETVDGHSYIRTYIPFPINDQNHGNLWVYEEVTERRKMEQAIIRAKEEAEQANMAKSEFLSKMSHELRTPLNGVLGFAQLLELEPTLDKKQQQFVQQILSGGRHLLHLMNEILDLSRIETGKLHLEFDVMYIEEIIHEAVQMVQPLANTKKIRIDQELEDCQQHAVPVDPVRLKQILLNLLENAIKYNREGGEVIVTCKKVNDELVVHICDTGIGFPPEEYNQIFDSFYRVQGTKEDGTGIGLSLVKQFVELMDGQLGVTSKVGEGSDFWFSLPIHLSAMNEVAAHQEEQIVEEEENVLHFRILYIEDNKANVQLIEQVLHSHPLYQLVTASTGEQGIELARNERMDLILLDMNLPDMNGYKVIEQLQNSRQLKELPVVALSANGMKKDIERALNSGFTAYLTKPIHLSEFFDLLDKMFREKVEE
ncbi:MHYT domain-containing protein [Bacillus sp. CGMCC 1.16541]|uniref:MHYT domain-containing protein n=1 Tax=Bacillus sp. CGMCC 1.16541 TaxID=2185143 RepID=UPI000D72AE5C|nr:MHYT domain-containing protein [Bacillus sp. CGMCC 1.16541]